MTAQRHVRAIAKLVAEQIEGEPRRLARRLADPGLPSRSARARSSRTPGHCIWRRSTRTGLAALCISWEEILAETVDLLERPRVRCARCGAGYRAAGASARAATDRAG